MTDSAVSVRTAVRNRVPPLLSVPLPKAVERRLLNGRWATAELAPPPPGSGLDPVPGDAGAPVVGHSFEVMHFGPEFHLSRQQRFGPVSWLHAFGRRIVVLAGPDAAQAALTNPDKALSQDGWDYFIGRFFGRGLMLLSFGEHHLHRRIMQDAFSRPRLAGYVEQMGPVLRRGVAGWPDGPGQVRVFPRIKRLTLDVATRVFMDVEPGEDQDAINRAFIATVRAGTAFVRYPVPGGRWSAGLSGRRTLERYFAARVDAKSAHDNGDLFSALCHARTDDGHRFTNADVINHMIFLMMAAHDTSTITASAAAYYLAKYPEWQERARVESLALGDPTPGIDALDELRTLDLVIKEALRLVPPVPSLVRETVTDTAILGRFVPAGTLVSLAPSTCHLSAEHWSEPGAFDPERFSDDRREDKSHRFAWIPFGGGAHKCIGLHFGTLEVKALLHEMLRTFTWAVPPDYSVRWDHTSLPMPTDGLPLRLTRR